MWIFGILPCEVVMTERDVRSCVTRLSIFLTVSPHQVTDGQRNMEKRELEIELKGACIICIIKECHMYYCQRCFIVITAPAEQAGCLKCCVFVSTASALIM